jgi:hypothetical protein
MTNNRSKKSKGGIDFGKLLFGRTNCGREIDNIMDSHPDYGKSETQIAEACESDIKNDIPLKPEHCKKLCKVDIANINASVRKTRIPRFNFLKKNCTECGSTGGKTRKQRKTKSRKQKKSKSRRQRK